MNFGAFVEGPLTWAVFIIFCSGILFRLSIFIFSIFKSRKNRPFEQKYTVKTLARFIFPLHKIFIKKPVYTVLRYVFHICMIIVPVGLAGHIILVESSSLGLSWISLPDEWADFMTIMFIILCFIFLARRIVIPEIRKKSSTFDYIFIMISVLPFLSGYFLAHGTLDSIPFFYDNMLIIHILSAQIMILTTVFLFVRSRLDKKKCTGCASCELSCPTGTLEANDKGKKRVFTYSHYQCVACGSCIESCPENAAELRHEFSPVKLFQIISKSEIRAVDLRTCERCGAYYAPELQLEKVSETIKEDYINFCPNCKKTTHANAFRQVSQKIRKIV